MLPAICITVYVRSSDLIYSPYSWYQPLPVSPCPKPSKNIFYSFFCEFLFLRYISDTRLHLICPCIWLISLRIQSSQFVLRQMIWFPSLRINNIQCVCVHAVFTLSIYLLLDTWVFFYTLATVTKFTIILGVQIPLVNFKFFSLCL